MEILDLVDGTPGNGSAEKTGFMNLRRLQPREKLPTAQSSHASEHQGGVEALILGLVDLLPKRESVWPVDERAKWLRLAAGIFDFGYKPDDGERKTISVAVVTAEPSNL